MKDKVSLFVTAFIQVMLVSMNVIFISKERILLMLLTGFGISLVWTLNVKRVAFGNWRDRFIYSFGAMAGTFVGYQLTRLII